MRGVIWFESLSGYGKHTYVRWCQIVHEKVGSSSSRVRFEDLKNA